MLKTIRRSAIVLITQAVLMGLLPASVLAATFELEEATIADINRAFDAGALTAEELVQLYLNRIKAYEDGGPKLKANQLCL